MIGQNIGLPYLMPMALEQLTTDSFAEGDFYGGDLLVVTLRVEEQFWRQRPELAEALAAIVTKALPELDERLGSEATKGHVLEARELFQRRSSRL